MHRGRCGGSGGGRKTGRVVARILEERCVSGARVMTAGAHGRRGGRILCARLSAASRDRALVGDARPLGSSAARSSAGWRAARMRSICAATARSAGRLTGGEPSLKRGQPRACVAAQRVEIRRCVAARRKADRPGDLPSSPGKSIRLAIRRGSLPSRGPGAGRARWELSVAQAETRSAGTLSRQSLA